MALPDNFIELCSMPGAGEDFSTIIPNCLQSQSPQGGLFFDGDENNNNSNNYFQQYNYDDSILNSSLDSNSSSHDGSDCGSSGWSLTRLSSCYPSYSQQLPDDDDDDGSVMLDDDERFLHDVDFDEQVSSKSKSYAARWETCTTDPYQYSNSAPYNDHYSPHDVMSDFTASSTYRDPNQCYPNLPKFPKFQNLIDTESSYPTVRHHYNGGSCDEESETDSDHSEHTQRKGKRGSKSILLWKFLLDSLADSQYAPQILKWEDKQSGIFKFVDTTAVAKLWGNQKRKGDMNFEKLSRGIRHYYRSGMMKRVEGKRLVYKFNWKMIPREYRRKSHVC